MDGLLEGFELYDVPLDDALVNRTVDELMGLADTMIINAAKAAAKTGNITLPPDYFPQVVRTECGISRASVRVQIERKKQRAESRPVSGHRHWATATSPYSRTIYKRCHFDVNSSASCGYANEEVAQLNKGDRVEILSGKIRSASGTEICEVKFQSWVGLPLSKRAKAAASDYEDSAITRPPSPAALG